MKKDQTCLTLINERLPQEWEKKKFLYKKQDKNIVTLFSSCSDTVMFYLRSVVTFNKEKTSLR